MQASKSAADKREVLVLLQATMMEIILWDPFMLYQIFFSPQVKRNVIISSKQSVYEKSHLLPTTERLKT